MARSKKSAGILLYRRTADGLQVLLGHPGGPFWKHRDLGAWTIPKGEIAEGEDAYAAARREFEEETGVVPGDGTAELKPRRQPSGKTIFVWAVEGDCDIACFKSNLFSMEWPPRSGTMAEFPELDRAEWFSLEEARRRILPGQAPFLAELESLHERPP